MRSLITLLLLIIVLPIFAAGETADGLYISAVLTRGERSRDSHARTTTIIIEDNKLVYDRTYKGHRANKSTPVHKEYEITGEDIKRLKKVIKAHDLLVSDKLDYPRSAGGFTYFEITLNLRLGEEKSLIEIAGPTKAAKIREEKLYKNSSALLEEIFRIINAQDKEIEREDDLINEAH